MNILLKTKKDAELHFGMKSTMAANLLGMTNRGERAIGFLTGNMDQGWDVTVGYFNEKARYIAFKKRTGTKWSDGDLRTVLMQIGRFSDWTIKSEYFDYIEKKGEEVVAEATGWKPQNRGYAFVYIPVVAGEIALMPDKTALDQKFPYTEPPKKFTAVGRDRTAGPVRKTQKRALPKNVRGA
jgi:hypothetical protein